MSGLPGKQKQVQLWVYFVGWPQHGPEGENSNAGLHLPLPKNYLSLSVLRTLIIQLGGIRNIIMKLCLQHVNSLFQRNVITIVK